MTLEAWRYFWGLLQNIDCSGQKASEVLTIGDLQKMKEAGWSEKMYEKVCHD